MRAACAALLVLVAPLAAQQQEQVARRLVLDASRALQAGNAARFLGYFDKRETAGFEELRENVLALLEIKDVASSVQIDKTEIDDGVATLTVDWLLQLTPQGDLGAAEERREVVTVKVRLDGKPRIVALAPAGLFGAGPAPAQGP